MSTEQVPAGNPMGPDGSRPSAHRSPKRGATKQVPAGNPMGPDGSRPSAHRSPKRGATEQVPAGNPMGPDGSRPSAHRRTRAEREALEAGKADRLSARSRSSADESEPKQGPERTPRGPQIGRRQEAPVRPLVELLQVSLQLQGAPSARRAYGRNRGLRLAQATGGEQGGRVTGDKRQGSPGSRRCWAAASAAPSGRKPYSATSCRARQPRHRPQPVPAVTPRCRATRAEPGRQARAECADRRTKGHSHRAGTPRIFQVGPSSVKGTRRSFLTASQKGSSGPTLERRSLCRPSGPDGEGQARGQARNARGDT